jgi:hypothetical protein
MSEPGKSTGGAARGAVRLAMARNWVNRRVETFSFLDAETVRCRMSIDLTLPAMSFVTAGDFVFVPLLALAKRDLRNLDVRGPDDRPLPVLTTQQNAEAVVRGIKEQLTPLLPPGTALDANHERKLREIVEARDVDGSATAYLKSDAPMGFLLDRVSDELVRSHLRAVPATRGDTATLTVVLHAYRQELLFPLAFSGLLISVVLALLPAHVYTIDAQTVAALLLVPFALSAYYIRGQDNSYVTRMLRGARLLVLFPWRRRYTRSRSRGSARSRRRRARSSPPACSAGCGSPCSRRRFPPVCCWLRSWPRGSGDAHALEFAPGKMRAAWRLGRSLSSCFLSRLEASSTAASWRRERGFALGRRRRRRLKSPAVASLIKLVFPNLSLPVNVEKVGATLTPAAGEGDDRTREEKLLRALDADARTPAPGASA